MFNLTDAHIHLFEAGFQGRSLAERTGVEKTEVEHYGQLRREHGVGQALVVGYAEGSWCRGNNHYLARMAAAHHWVRPLAFVPHPAELTVETLRRRRREGFVGLSLYIFSPEQVEALGRVKDDVWGWLESHHWLISVNSRGPAWTAWQAVLERYEGLHLLISHLGLPEPVDASLGTATARARMAPVLALAEFSGPRIKLSGFYALTEPGCPHSRAWSYAEAALERFGPDRLLWGSDFSPHLQAVEFTETVAAVRSMPFLGEPARVKIFTGNLEKLLGAIGSGEGD